jgi:uncharacterized membrane protein
VRWLNLIGIACVIVGSTLLYFHAIPYQRMQGVILWGPLAMRVDDPPSGANPVEWQEEANALIKRTTVLSRLGFGLIAAGSFLQLIAAATP